MDNKSKFNSWAFSILLVFITGLFSGCNFLPEEEPAIAPPLVEPQRQEYELFKVERKAQFTKYFTGVGSLKSVDQQQLCFTESGKRLKSINVKYGDIVEKGAIIAQTDSAGLEDDIKLQRISVEKVNIELDQLKNQYSRYLSLSEEYQPSKTELENLQNSIKLKELDLQRENLILDRSLNEYAKSTLVSPISGLVTYISTLREGDMITPFEPVVIIDDPRQLQVTCGSSDTDSVITGMPAEVTYNGEKYEGKVVLSKDSIPIKDLEKFKDKIIITVAGLPENAEVGDNVNISIAIASKENTLVIPKRALQRLFGKSVVNVMSGESRKEYDVEVGIETTTEVEILSGLEEGQMVILL